MSGNLTIIDESGKQVSLKDIDLNTVLKLVSNSESRKKKIQNYKELEKVEPMEGNKGIRFRFKTGNHLEYSFITKQITHGANNLPVLPAHFKNVDIVGQESRGFWSGLGKHAEELWIRKFFGLIDHAVDRGCNTAREYVARNRLKYLVEDLSDVVQPFETIAKAEILQKHETSQLFAMSRNLGTGSNRYADAKTIIKAHFNSWFIDHQDEQVDPIWYGRNGLTLKNEYSKYKVFMDSNLGNVFEYCWEKYQRPLSFDSHKLEQFKRMLTVFNYDYKRLIDYLMVDLVQQGIILKDDNIRYNDTFTELYDYANMNHEMRARFDKYPRYLATMHDVTGANYNFWKRRSNSDASVLPVEKLKKLEFSDDSYSVIAPQTGADIITEGSSLSHCVASYVNNVVYGKTNIMFMRDKLEPNSSLVTIEINNENVITQARGFSNRDLYELEKKFLEKYKKFLKEKTEKEKKEAEEAEKAAGETVASA